jgi:hypothetical protein
MRKQTRTALRWGPPVALAAAAIAALFVVPVFGRATSNLGDRVNATRLDINSARAGPGVSPRLGSLPLRKGNYVVTSTLTVQRVSSETLACRLRLHDNSGDKGSDVGETLGPLGSNPNAPKTLSWNGISLSAAAHVGAGGRAILECFNGKAILEGTEITAMEVPRLTLKQRSP